MQERTCPVDGTEHQRRGIYCSPRCKKRMENHKRRGTSLQPVCLPFECAECGTHCVPGKTVAPHASRFCGHDCKAAWHKVHIELPALVLNSVTAEATPHQVVDYRRAMLSDPCSYCGSPSQARDHIIPRSAGGADGWENRTGSCHSCNSTKQESPLLTFLAWRQARSAFEPWRRIVAEIHTRRGEKGEGRYS